MAKDTEPTSDEVARQETKLHPDLTEEQEKELLEIAEEKRKNKQPDVSIHREKRKNDKTKQHT